MRTHEQAQQTHPQALSSNLFMIALMNSSFSSSQSCHQDPRPIYSNTKRLNFRLSTLPSSSLRFIYLFTYSKPTIVLFIAFCFTTVMAFFIASIFQAFNFCKSISKALKTALQRVSSAAKRLLQEQECSSQSILNQSIIDEETVSSGKLFGAEAHGLALQDSQVRQLYYSLFQRHYPHTTELQLPSSQPPPNRRRLLQAESTNCLETNQHAACGGELQQSKQEIQRTQEPFESLIKLQQKHKLLQLQESRGLARSHGSQLAKDSSLLILNALNFQGQKQKGQCFLCFENMWLLLPSSTPSTQLHCLSDPTITSLSVCMPRTGSIAPSMYLIWLPLQRSFQASCPNVLSEPLNWFTHKLPRDIQRFIGLSQSKQFRHQREQQPPL